MIGKLNKLLGNPYKNIPLVLAIDDDLDNLLFISYILDALNLKYVLADTSGDGISLAINQRPDLILLDIVMPKIDGVEITRRLKQNSVTKDIPIIAVTGLTRTKHREAIEVAGCNDYICKPFLIEDMETKIIRFLNLCLIEISR